MDPVTIALLVAGGIAIASITFFVTSAKAKERARRYQQKVNGLLEKLLERVRRAREKAEQARTQADAQTAEAEKAEAAATTARADASAARQHAAELRCEANDMERKLREADALIARLQREVEAWRSEAMRAASLVNVAGRGFSFKSARVAHAVVVASMLPLTKIDNQEFGDAVESKARELAAIADSAESLLDDVLGAIVPQVPGSQSPFGLPASSVVEK